MDSLHLNTLDVVKRDSPKRAYVDSLFVAVVCCCVSSSLLFFFFFFFDVDVVAAFFSSVSSFSSSSSSSSLSSSSSSSSSWLLLLLLLSLSLSSLLLMMMIIIMMMLFCICQATSFGTIWIPFHGARQRRARANGESVADRDGWIRGKQGELLNDNQFPDLITLF